MKKILALAAVLFACFSAYAQEQEEITYEIWPGMPYKLVKQIYDPDDYVKSKYDEFNPALSGTISFFIPGLGQMINKEFGRGMLLLGGHLACSSMAYGGAMTTLIVAMGEPVGVPEEEMPQFYASRKAALRTTISVMFAGIIGNISLRIASCAGASNMAKRKNMLYHDLYYSNYSYAPELNISPDFTCLPGSSGLQMAPGISLKLSF